MPLYGIYIALSCKACFHFLSFELICILLILVLHQKLLMLYDFVEIIAITSGR